MQAIRVALTTSFLGLFGFAELFANYGAPASASFDIKTENQSNMPNSVARLLTRNLNEVFGENDPVRRRKAELSPRTFCTFPREFPSIRRQGSAVGHNSDPRQGSVHLLVRRASRFSRHRLQTHGPVGSPSSEPRSALHGHATASMKGHVSHDADRFASTRVRRAATARDVRSAGTASPVPKYISSGVCP